MQMCVILKITSKVTYRSWPDIYGNAGEEVACGFSLQLWVD